MTTEVHSHPMTAFELGINFMLYKIKENSWLARIAAWKLGANNVALVLGRTIHLYNTNARDFLSDKRWVQHELKHIEQFEKHGFCRFIILYLWESLMRGYYHNKYEVEARESEY